MVPQAVYQWLCHNITAISYNPNAKTTPHFAGSRGGLTEALSVYS